MRVLIAFSIATFFLAPVYAQPRPIYPVDPDGYDRLLLSVYLSTAQRGAYGSLWASELTVRNDGSEPVQVFQDYCSFFCYCGVIFLCLERPLDSGERLDNSLYLANGFFFPFSPGAFLYTQRRARPNLTVGLRIRDVSRSAISAGTELPVVRQDDFRATAIRLINVPLDSRSRVHLRVYAVPIYGETREAVVRVFELDDAVPLAERHLALISPQEFIGTPPQEELTFPAYPAYSEIANLRDIAPSLANIQSARIEVEPVSPGLRLWAFVTVTNNESQQVTTVTPQ